jgi:hypothetical protein
MIVEVVGGPDCGMQMEVQEDIVKVAAAERHDRGYIEVRMPVRKMPDGTGRVYWVEREPKV